jgi:16S rRNA (adenine1518-N6/adenine1519-N6)-dimethyltransferase
LHEQVADLANVEIIHGDVLEFTTSRFHDQAYKVVGNLPYYITSAILRHFLENVPRPQLIVVTVQREVAARIVADPGDMSLLAVSVQLYGRPRIVARIPAGAFYPPPAVHSAVLRIELSEHPSLLQQAQFNETQFFRVVRAGFSQKRKTLRNSLSAGLGLSPTETEHLLEQAGIDPRSRAETLSLEEWARVTGLIYH